MGNAGRSAPGRKECATWKNTEAWGSAGQECRGVVGAVEAGKIWALYYVRGLGFQFRAMQHKQRFLKYGKVPAVAPFKTE